MFHARPVFLSSPPMPAKSMSVRQACCGPRFQAISSATFRRVSSSMVSVSPPPPTIYLGLLLGTLMVVAELESRMCSRPPTTSSFLFFESGFSEYWPCAAFFMMHCSMSKPEGHMKGREWLSMDQMDPLPPPHWPLATSATTRYNHRWLPPPPPESRVRGQGPGQAASSPKAWILCFSDTQQSEFTWRCPAGDLGCGEIINGCGN